MNLNLFKRTWLLAAMLLATNALLAQKTDSAAIKKHTFYYWGGINLGGGWGAIGRAEGSGLSYGALASVLLDHNFIKIKASATQDFNNIIILTGGTKSNCKNYDLLLGRQLPIGRKAWVSIASGISHLNYYSEFNPDGVAGQPYQDTRTGIPLEFTLMHSPNRTLGGTLSFELIFNRGETMGNFTIGIALGKVREKLDNDKKL